MRQYYKDKVTIGFSATPDYHDEKRTADLLEHQIFQLTLHDAVQGRMLAPVTGEHRNLVLEFDENDLPEDKRERRKVIIREYFKKRLEDCMPDIQKAVREGNGVLVRCPPGDEVDYAFQAAKRIRQTFVTTEDRSYSGFIRATGIGGPEQNRSDHNILIERFNNTDPDEADKRIHVICYVNLINTGADLPPAKLWIDLYHGAARVPMVQGIGRVLRLIYDKNGKPIPAKVITYHYPYMDNQYTCNDALEMKPGTATLNWGKSGYHERYTKSPFVYSEVMSVTRTGGMVGTVALEHGGVELDPNQNQDAQNVLSFNQACTEYDIDPTQLRAFMDRLGYEAEPQLEADEYFELAIGLLDELPTIQEQTEPRMVAFAQACRELDLDPTLVQRYMQKAGYGDAAELPEDDFMELVALIEEEGAFDSAGTMETSETTSMVAPEVRPGRSTKRQPPKIRELPDTGFVPVEAVMGYYNWKGSRTAFLSQLRNQTNIPIRRFRDPADKQVKYYIPEKNAPKIN